MDHLQEMGSKVEKGSVLQPQVDLERDFVEIAGTIKGHVVVPEGDLGRCKAMCGNERGLLEITIGADVIEMLMGIDHDIDIPHLQAQERELFLKVQETLVQARIDQDIPDVPSHQVAMASFGRASQEINPPLNLFNFCLHPFPF
jgi:hypothetical protein